MEVGPSGLSRISRDRRGQPQRLQPIVCAIRMWTSPKGLGLVLVRYLSRGRAEAQFWSERYQKYRSLISTVSPGWILVSGVASMRTMRPLASRRLR
jgi:hypothetical protein